MYQMNASKNRLLILLAIFFVFFIGNACKESEILETHAKISVPADQFDIPVIDSSEYAVSGQFRLDFESYFHDYFRGHDILSFLKVANYVSSDSLHFSGSKQEIRFPSFVDHDSYLLARFDSASTMSCQVVMNNLVVLRQSIKSYNISAFYIGWINRPIYRKFKEFTPHWENNQYYYTDNIDSTTFEVFTTIDTNIFRKMYNEYTGRITCIKIDTIFLPTYYTNTLNFYSKIRLLGFDNGEPIFAPPCGFSIIPEEIRDSVLEERRNLVFLML